MRVSVCAPSAPRVIAHAGVQDSRCARGAYRTSHTEVFDGRDAGLVCCGVPPSRERRVMTIQRLGVNHPSIKVADSENFGLLRACAVATYYRV